MSNFSEIFSGWLNGQIDHATFHQNLLAEQFRNDHEIEALAADKPFGIEFKANCSNDGGWRESIEQVARIGFSTREEAEKWCEEQSADGILVYRVVERTKEKV